MQTDILLLSGILAVFGSYMLWAAYQIQFAGRVDLVQFGSGPLPGATLVKRQFAALHVFLGVTFLSAGLLIVLTSSMSPGVWIFVSGSCASAVRRQILIRAIEIKAAKCAAE